MPESFSFLITSSLLRGFLTLFLIVVLTIVALRLVNMAAATIEKRFIAPIEDLDRRARLQTLRKATKSTIQVIILINTTLIGLGTVAVALSLTQLAHLVWAKGDRIEARQLCGECIAVCRDQGDDWWLSATLNRLGNFEMASGDEMEAQQHWIEAVKVASRGGFHANVLDALVGIATVRAFLENPDAWSKAHGGKTSAEIAAAS